jgi:transcriptional regulator with XRE-family HTH domain
VLPLGNVLSLGVARARSPVTFIAAADLVSARNAGFVVNHAAGYDLGVDESKSDVAAVFGDFVRAQRRLAKISQRELARVSGVSDSYLSQVERGQYRPSASVLRAIAQAFGMSPATLYAQFGLLDPEPDRERTTVEEAIRLADDLSQDHKSVLLTVYRALRDTGSSVPSR